MSILAGSYERFLFGYAVQGNGDELKRSFTHAAHKGVVKCIAAAGQFAATGGADDLIHLYDLKNDKDLGFLMSPGEGAVTALAFFTPAGGYAPTHLLSGSADGSISVWSVGGGWECMKTMRGHRKEVYGIAVHPSGLLGLSVSRDGFLKMWDLVKGRCTYTARLEAEAEAVHFCGEDGGARYALLCGTLLTLHSVGEEGTLRALAHPRRVLCMAWAPGRRIVTGSEDGSLRLWDSQTGDELLCINRAHSSRIRALALVPSSSSSSPGGEAAEEEEEEPLLVATASSDGSIKLWDLSKAAAAAPGSSGGACLAEEQTRARLTCLATADLPAVMQQRLQQAARARQKAAAAAQQQQQQGEGEGGKKRKQAAAGGKAPKQQRAGEVEEQQQRPAKKAKQQGKQQGAAPPAQQQQQPGKGKPAKAGKPGKAGGKQAAAAAAAPESGVVVHDGVVEFLDSPEQAKKAKKKQQQVAAKRRAAAQHGKRPAMPGSRFKGGGAGGKRK